MYQQEQGEVGRGRMNGAKQGLVLALFLGLAQVGGAQTASGKADTKAANTVTIHLDPAATAVRWTLKSLLHNAHGTFKLKGGDVVMNPATGLAQGEILIDAGSESSGDTARDARWQKEILDAATYPAILFHPVKVEGLKAGEATQQIQASGMLTLKGQDHPLEMTLAVKIEGSEAVLTTHFTIPYVQWGLKEARSGMTRYDKQIVMDVSAKGEVKNEVATHAPAPAADSQ